MALARTFKRNEFQAKGGRGRRRGKRKEKVKKENEILLGLWGSSFPATGPPPTHCNVWVGDRCVLLCGDQRTS